MHRLRRKALLAVGLGAFALLCWHFGFGDLADALAHARPAYLVVYLSLAVAVFLGYSLRWFFVARRLGAKSRLSEIVAARISGDAFGSLLPGARIAGDPVRIALLTAGGARGPLASAGVAIDRILELIGNMLCTVAYVTVFSFTRSTGHTGLGLVTVMLLLLAALAVPLLMLRRGLRPFSILFQGSWFTSWRPLVCETEDHLMRFFRGDPGGFIVGLFGTLLIEALIVVEYYFLLASFGIELELGMLLMAIVATGLARGIPTPAGLGALEGAEVMLFAVASGQPEAGFVIGMIMRLHETFWITVGFAVLLARGLSLERLLRAPERAPV